MFNHNYRKNVLFRIISLMVIQSFIFTSSSFAYPVISDLSREKIDLRVTATKVNPLILSNIEQGLNDYPSDSLYLSQLPRDQIEGKTFIIRVDYNVPTDAKGNITDDSRIKASLETINFIRERGGRVVLMSHLGRPKGVDESLRLDKIAQRLEKLSGIPVKKFNDIVNDEIKDYVQNEMGRTGEIVLLENVRFSAGDETGDDDFALKLADLADIFVLDGFGVSHRGKQATVGGIAKHIPGVKGLLVEKEERGLNPVLTSKDSMVVFLGGSKVSDKVKMIEGFLEKVNRIYVGGGMAVPFLKVMGNSIGSSKVAEEDLEIAERIYTGKHSWKLLLPMDLLIVDRFSTKPEEMKDAKYKVVPVGPKSVPEGWYIVDIGPSSVLNFRNSMNAIKPQTILWNGNMGVSELKPAAEGTKGVAKLIADFTVNKGAKSIICGGNTAEAVEKFRQKDKMTFVSTGGGAAIEFIENNGNLSGFTNLAKATILRDSSNLAKKKGDVLHEAEVNEMIAAAFVGSNENIHFNAVAKDVLRKYLDREGIRKLGPSVNIANLNRTLSEMDFKLVNNVSEPETPALVLKDKNNYQVAHVGLGRRTAYFPSALIQDEDFYRNNQDLLEVLFLREVILLNSVLEFFEEKRVRVEGEAMRDNPYYNEAVNKAEEFAEKIEKMLVGDRLDEYVQNKIDRFLGSSPLVPSFEKDLEKMAAVQRRPIIGGNWKMAVTSADEARELLRGIAKQVRDIEAVDIVVCPSAVHLKDVVTALKQLENAGEIPAGRIHVAAQNMWAEEKGAFTSGISAPQLTEIDVDYVLLGHSEVRRSPSSTLTGESNQNINRKLKTALKYNLTPIVCVGESLNEREAGRTQELLNKMIRESLADIDARQARNIVIAYEPVWAIGTGKTATPEEANEAISFIRGVLSNMFGPEVASRMRIQYGGSVKAENIGNLIAKPHIDGALVGGDSLKAEKFVPIVKQTADYVTGHSPEMWAKAFPNINFPLSVVKASLLSAPDNQQAVIINYQMLLDNPSIGLAIMNATKQLGKERGLKFVLAYAEPEKVDTFYKAVSEATGDLVDLKGKFDMVVSTKDSAETVVQKVKSNFSGIEKIEVIGPATWAQAYQKVPGLDLNSCVLVVCGIGEGNTVTQGDLALWAGLNALIDEEFINAEDKKQLFALRDKKKGIFKVESKEIVEEAEGTIKNYREVLSSE